MNLNFPLKGIPKETHNIYNDADEHFSGVQIDTAIVLVLLIVKSHGAASLLSLHLREGHK